MSATLVSTLRARPGTLRIGDSATGDAITFRAQVPEVWDAVRIQAPASATVLEAKRRALAELLPNDSEVEGYVVKMLGYEVLDESVSLARAGVRNGSTLLITSRRRRPVR